MMRRSSSTQQLAVRNAAAIACEHSKLKKNSKSASEYCKYAKAAIEFQLLALKTEQALLEDLASMVDEEKVKVLFTLIKKKDDGKIDAQEIINGLRNIHGSSEFERRVSSAIDEAMKGKQEMLLDHAAFQTVIQVLVDNIDCTVSELVEMLVVQVVFATTGFIFDEANNVDESTSSKADGYEADNQEYRKALIDERMKALFGLFDIDHDGLIDFKEVVLGMYKITERIEKASKAAVNAVLMFDDDHVRALDYQAFTKLIINVVAASPDNIHFDDVADSMTRHAAQPIAIGKDDLSHLWVMDKGLEMFKVVEDDSEQKQDGSRTHDIPKILLAKIDRLFNLWDVDHDQYIDFHELALGIRKFQETTQLNDAVEESVHVMNSFDKDKDQKLDRSEFARFIVKFASMLKSDLAELIDFMIVAISLKENIESEKQYIKSIKASDIYYWGF